MADIPKESRIGLIAGRGSVPDDIIKTAQHLNLFICIIAFEGQTPQTINDYALPILWVKLGTIQPILDFFKKNQVTLVTCAGGIQRPSVRDLSLDWKGVQWLKALGPSFLKGDDELLKKIIALTQEQGYQVVAAHTLLNQYHNVFLKPGMQTNHTLTDQDQQDILTGQGILAALSPFDVGQAVIIDKGRVLGIEAAEGTDALINRIGTLESQHTEKKGILIKMHKTTQTLLADVPTIGLKTLENAHKANLKGIAVSAQGVQVLDQPAILERAPTLNTFLYAF